MSGQIVKTVYTDSDVGIRVDVDVSTSSDMKLPVRVGVQTISADRVTTHSITGLLPATTYYGRLVLAETGAYFGEPFSFTTAPATSGSWTRRIAVVSCQHNRPTHTQAWQDVGDWAPDGIWHLGDFGYWGQDISDSDPHSKDVDKYAHSAQANPIMRQALQSSSLDVVCISDHELHDNGDRWHRDSPEDTLGCLHSVRELRAFQAMMPVRDYWDTRSPRKHRGYHFDLGTTVRVLVTDFRSPERSFASDADTPAKQMWGAAQEKSLFAALDPSRVNIIVNETSWWWGRHVGGRDKPASYPDAQQRLIHKVNGTGPHAGGPVYKVVWVGGDRHYVGYLSAAENDHGGWPCHISSGMDKNSLELVRGENPTWQYGANLRTVQKVALHGAVRRFTLTFAGQTTAPVSARASASTVSTALEALANIEPGDVVVWGAAGGPWGVHFGGRLYRNTIRLTGASEGGSLTVAMEDAPVVGYLQMTLSYDAGTDVVSLSTKGRAVLDTSGPDTGWVVRDIPGGVATDTWAL